MLRDCVFEFPWRSGEHRSGGSAVSGLGICLAQSGWVVECCEQPRDDFETFLLTVDFEPPACVSAETTRRCVYAQGFTMRSELGRTSDVVQRFEIALGLGSCRFRELVEPQAAEHVSGLSARKQERRAGQSLEGFVVVMACHDLGEDCGGDGKGRCKPLLLFKRVSLLVCLLGLRRASLGFKGSHLDHVAMDDVRSVRVPVGIAAD